MDFGLFTTWNAVYEGGKVPWDPDYRDGKLLEAEAYKQNFREIEHIEDAGWGLRLVRRRSLLHPGQHGPPVPHAVCRHRQPHQEHKDWHLHPPPDPTVAQ